MLHDSLFQRPDVFPLLFTWSGEPSDVLAVDDWFCLRQTVFECQNAPPGTILLVFLSAPCKVLLVQLHIKPFYCFLFAFLCSDPCLVMLIFVAFVILFCCYCLSGILVYYFCLIFLTVFLVFFFIKGSSSLINPIHVLYTTCSCKFPTVTNMELLIKNIPADSKYVALTMPAPVITLWY